MAKLYRCLLLLFLCSSLFTNAYSTQKTLQFKQLTVKDGLNSPIVTSIVQDYRGYMWFGTRDGLNKYDGVNIESYTNIPSDSTSLLSNYIKTIFEDHKHNLFFGTGYGLSQYDRDSDRFINASYDNSSALFGIHSLVMHIAEDTIGNLWLATAGSGLVYFDRRNNKTTTYRNDPSVPGSINDNQVEAVYVDRFGRVWICTNKGLDLFVPETADFNHIETCKTHHDTIASINFLDIIGDREGNVWFGSSDGLFCLEKSSTSFELTHYKNSPADPGSLSNNRAKSLCIDSEDKLWIGTENGGLNLFDRKTQSFFHYRINEFNPMSLNNESIHAIAQDRNDNLWLGTYGGGVNLSVKKSDFIVYYKNLPGALQSLSSNIVIGFVEDRKHRIVVGTDGGGFNLFNDTTGRFVRFNSQNTAIKSDAITAMHLGKDDRIWLGTWEGGLVKVDFDHTTVRSLTTHNSGIPDNSIFSIAQDTLGDLWLGSFRHGLIHYQIQKNKFSAYAPEQVDIRNNDISVVRVDPKGRIYVAPGFGPDFFIFSPGEKRFARYLVMPDTTDQGNNNVYDILFEDDTCAWMATQKGLFRFNPVSGNKQWYFPQDGGSAAMIKGLTFDKSRILWLATNAGIYRFDYRNNVMKQFTTSDGLQSDDFCKASIMTTTTGHILAGGTNGFNLISPERYAENRLIPHVVITDLHIFNQKATIGTKDSPLKKQMSETKKMTLSHKQSVITFYFAALDFTDPTKNQYAYRMENFDKNWTYCGNKKEATYTNLNPGKYLFHVKGSNNDGVWNETGTTLELTITPPWWKTGLARTGFGLIAFFIILFIYRYRMDKLRAENDRSKAEATAAAKSQFLATMSHEIRTPLNHIIGLTYLALKQTDPEKILNFIKKTIRSGQSLQALINNILDFSKIESGNLKLEKEPFNIYDFLEAQSEMFATQVLDKGIGLEFLVEEDVPVTLNGDALRLNQVLTNLISNAVKFTDKGEVVVSVALKSRDDASVCLRFCISDTGIGLDATQISRLFSAFSQAEATTTRKYGGTGLGLIISKRLIELMQGSITVESMVGKGSNFIFEALFGALPEPDNGSLCFPEKYHAMQVLVVDDCPTMRLLMKRFIEKMGLSVDEATNGNDAIEKIALGIARATPYACIVVDYGLPQMDGIAVVTKIRATPETQSLPVVLMTGFRQDEIQRLSRNAGANALLFKPVKKALLYRTLGEALKIFQVASAQPSSDCVLQGAAILLAEDNELNVEITKTILQDAGAIVTVAINGLEACRLAGEQPPDAILMDLHMPEMDGIEASRTIRAIPGVKDVPIIAFTASVSAEERALCLSVGICDYVIKPVDPTSLIKTMRTWVYPKQPTSSEVSIDSSKPSASTSIQSLMDRLPDFDVSGALKRVNNKADLYCKLLRSFAENNTVAGKTAVAAIEAGDFETARSLVHNIRGVAGNLGLTELFRCAKDLEDNLVGKAAYNEVKITLQAFCSGLDKTLKAMTAGVGSINIPSNSSSPKPA
jgi:signal transduction histidine kinase/CheY-like chemotaxis protein/ligand-binding sensor domain-containing protein/HPt (histidine-containing phosphotransfer) domain-containing protein